MKEYIVYVEDDERDIDELFIGYIRKQTELIRCKDCKHCTETGYYHSTRWNYCAWFRRMMTENDFCSWAEPKETGK